MMAANLFLPQLAAQSELNFDASRYGDLPKWQASLAKLPSASPSTVNLNKSSIQIGRTTDISDSEREIMRSTLMELHPWRKGPFNFFGIEIDTEWRSDMKWDRLLPHIDSLNGKKVLDVGCGSGYHCWRMRGAGASEVIGIEPTLLFIIQFQVAQKYIKDSHVQVLPLRMEDMPAELEVFDSTFSMGILYHRRSPMDHLLELKGTLANNGQLILETLVIEGKLGDTLMPEGRYGKMGNVWFIPSVATLISWLHKTGFTDVQCVDVSPTTSAEQRSTDWMRFQSLSDFLDPNDSTRTAEGYPAPLRAVFTARKKT